MEEQFSNTNAAPSMADEGSGNTANSDLQQQQQQQLLMMAQLQRQALIQQRIGSPMQGQMATPQSMRTMLPTSQMPATATQSQTGRPMAQPSPPNGLMNGTDDLIPQNMLMQMRNQILARHQSAQASGQSLQLTQQEQMVLALFSQRQQQQQQLTQMNAAGMTANLLRQQQQQMLYQLMQQQQSLSPQLLQGNARPQLNSQNSPPSQTAVPVVPASQSAGGSPQQRQNAMLRSPVSQQFNLNRVGMTAGQQHIMATAGQNAMASTPNLTAVNAAAFGNQNILQARINKYMAQLRQVEETLKNPDLDQQTRDKCFSAKITWEQELLVLQKQFAASITSPEQVPATTGINPQQLSGLQQVVNNTPQMGRSPQSIGRKATGNVSMSNTTSQASGNSATAHATLANRGPPLFPQSPNQSTNVISCLPLHGLNEPQPVSGSHVFLNHSLSFAANSTNLPKIDFSQGKQSKRKLSTLISQIEPSLKLNSHLEEMILEVADIFIEQVVSKACKVAKFRGSSSLETKDIRLELEANWNLRIPGVSRPDYIPRKITLSSSHATRLNSVNRAKRDRRFAHMMQATSANRPALDSLSETQDEQGDIEMNDKNE